MDVRVVYLSMYLSVVLLSIYLSIYLSVALTFPCGHSVNTDRPREGRYSSTLRSAPRARRGREGSDSPLPGKHAIEISNNHHHNHNSTTATTT